VLWLQADEKKDIPLKGYCWGEWSGGAVDGLIGRGFGKRFGIGDFGFGMGGE
jgi:hypothetical protein